MRERASGPTYFRAGGAWEGEMPKPKKFKRPGNPFKTPKSWTKTVSVEGTVIFSDKEKDPVTAFSEWHENMTEEFARGKMAFAVGLMNSGTSVDGRPYFRFTGEWIFPKEVPATALQRGADQVIQNLRTAYAPHGIEFEATAEPVTKGS